MSFKLPLYLSGLVVTALDLQLRGLRFKSRHRMLKGCPDFAPNMTRLALNRLQRLVDGRKTHSQ